MRKIIHIDMDCFYAAVEIRDNPSLANKPVAVGGSTDQRGVLCTCNYIAREYGLHSAMPTSQALKRCPSLVLLPVSMTKYREVSKNIHKIFAEFTAQIEPLSLDEAYLDVTKSSLYQGSATRIAENIKQRIWETEQLTASAGVAPNKFLAKIASGWKKPNGLFVITPNEVANFIKDLPLKKLHGVGKVTAEKLQQLGLVTCADLQKFPAHELFARFGKFGKYLYDQARGIDDREVIPNRPRKSLSIERTFPQDLDRLENGVEIISHLYQELLNRLRSSELIPFIKNAFIKIKFSDFKQKTCELATKELELEKYQILFTQAYSRGRKKPIRLIGLGVHFDNPNDQPFQNQLFSSEFSLN